MEYLKLKTGVEIQTDIGCEFHEVEVQMSESDCLQDVVAEVRNDIYAGIELSGDEDEDGLPHVDPAKMTDEYLKESLDEAQKRCQED